MKPQITKQANFSSEEIPLTGNVWKLGCNWGKKKPNFYEMINRLSLIICVHDKTYAPGDLIVIAEGHTIRALAKVLENPKPVTD
jgi:hypothetical protein